MKYHMSQKDSNDTVTSYFDISLYVHCDYCRTVMCNNFTSQTGYRHGVAQPRKLGGDEYKCKVVKLLKRSHSSKKSESVSQERAL